MIQHEEERIAKLPANDQGHVEGYIRDTNNSVEKLKADKADTKVCPNYADTNMWDDPSYKSRKSSCVSCLLRKKFFSFTLLALYRLKRKMITC